MPWAIVSSDKPDMRFRYKPLRGLFVNWTRHRKGHHNFGHTLEVGGKLPTVHAMSGETSAVFETFYFYAPMVSRFAEPMCRPAACFGALELVAKFAHR